MDVIIGTLGTGDSYWMMKLAKDHTMNKLIKF